MLELHPVTDDQPRHFAFDLAPEDRSDLSFGSRNPVHRSIPLEDGSEQSAHHSEGVRAIASSSAALTS